MQGYLNKRGSFRRSSMRRWIVLSNGSIFVYRSRLGEWGEEEVEDVEVRKQSLLAHYRIEGVNEEESKQENGFLIALDTDETKLLVLQASSLTEKEEWLKGITCSVETRNGFYIKG